MSGAVQDGSRVFALADLPGVERACWQDVGPDDSPVSGRVDLQAAVLAWSPVWQVYSLAVSLALLTV
jgi:hypothetical protein